MSRTSAVETIHFFIHNEYVMSAGPSNVCVCHLFDCLDISVCVYLYRSVYTCSKGRAKKRGGERSCPKRLALRV